MSIQWGDVPAWVGGAVAVISAGVATWQASEARKARKESARWAEDSANASVRSADAAERSLALQEAAARAAEPVKVAWRIDLVRNLMYRLRNIGTETATGVTVEDRRGGSHLSSLPSPNPLARNLPEGVDIRANQAHDFVLIPVAEYPLPTEVWIRWDGQPEAIAVAIP